MNSMHVQDVISPIIGGANMHPFVLASLTNSVSLIALVIIFALIKLALVPKVKRMLSRFSRAKIAFLAPQLSKLSGRVALLICSMLFVMVNKYLFVAPLWVMAQLQVLAQVILIIAFGFLVSSLMNIAHAIYQQQKFAKDVPIKGIVQLAKLMVFIVTTVLVVSTVVDKSPTYILSGFGAIAAVTLLVFKDTILGLVASIQIAANKLVATGDWIQVDTFGADGEVIDLGLNTVRVRNWDNTVTTIPTYALISDSFKNWRAMQESAGRRIKRTIPIDMNSVSLLSEQQLIVLKDKFVELNALKLPEMCSNLTAFRMYAELLLKQRPEINTECICMVRELSPTHNGLPIELYCFSKDKSWVNYEHIQANILDQMLLLIKEFELRPYQTFDTRSVMA
ncbi:MULTISPECIES: mechanosensitive ion channel family protein [Pseudoalteromonas]|uniref:Mechanosensitive ion channel n=1 Tax=Pseudoalteromonas obscura TaxID=3048491 RepID=A0ABT7EUA8_9GAMM|nr:MULTISPECIES: mechanosensitive ion channel domain-containing protein [Pseudoalteromonas]MBQ4839955.1 mechanosensitive ion channel [Pseudoalteromonas luteoviolacea]MDK2598593.1 mechanosensitive ion channel [Pseudoalteromonas sp. P94(2023)]